MPDQLGQERPVRLEPVDLAQLGATQPADLVVLDRRRISGDRDHRDPQLVGVTDRGRAGPARR